MGPDIEVAVVQVTGGFNSLPYIVVFLSKTSFGLQ